MDMIENDSNKAPLPSGGVGGGLHPLEIFKYCPVCGSAHFEVNNFKSKKCRDCGFTYYANPCSATAAFIVNDNNELLVVRRAKEPAK